LQNAELFSKKWNDSYHTQVILVFDARPGNQIILYKRLIIYTFISNFVICPKSVAFTEL
jgi:hypothetical protein